MPPRLVGGPGQKGLCPRGGGPGYGRRHREGPPPRGSLPSWGASRTHPQPELAARGNLPEGSVSREPRVRVCAGHVFNWDGRPVLQDVLRTPPRTQLRCHSTVTTFVRSSLGAGECPRGPATRPCAASHLLRGWVRLCGLRPQTSPSALRTEHLSTDRARSVRKAPFNK